MWSTHFLSFWAIDTAVSWIIFCRWWFFCFHSLAGVCVFIWLSKILVLRVVPVSSGGNFRFPTACRTMGINFVVFFLFFWYRYSIVILLFLCLEKARSYINVFFFYPYRFSLFLVYDILKWIALCVLGFFFLN